MRSLPLFSLLSVVALASVACGSADTVPLGGPHGGSSTANVAPTQGSGAPTQGSGAESSSGSNGGTTDPTDDGADSGAPADAGAATPAATDAGMVMITGTPTWTEIYKAYLAPGTMGGCVTCHSEMSTAASAYTWLSSQQQLGGASPELTNPSKSCLTWLGGNMPPSGPTSEPAASSALQAWATAGAMNN